MEHATFAPSSMGRLMTCSGSHIMTALYGNDQEETPEAIEGTLAALVAATKATKPAEIMNDPDITDEMLEFADAWVDIIKPFRSGCFVETRVDGTAIHDECFGTPDFYHINRDTKRVYIADYKFGHKPTNAEWQLITYAICIKTWLHLDNEWTFELAVYQPRANHSDGTYRTRVVTSEVLNGKLLELRKRIEEALSDNPVCTVSKEGCYMCPAAHRCGALAEAATTMASWFSGAATPLRLSPEQESAELDRLEAAQDIIKHRATSLKQAIIGGLKSGKQGYSYVLEQKPGREVWNDGLESVKILEALYNVVLVTEKPITPKQAITKKIPAEVVRQFSTVPMQKEQLVKFKSKFNNEVIS